MDTEIVKVSRSYGALAFKAPVGRNTLVEAQKTNTI